MSETQIITLQKNEWQKISVGDYGVISNSSNLPVTYKQVHAVPGEIDTEGHILNPGDFVGYSTDDFSSVYGYSNCGPARLAVTPGFTLSKSETAQTKSERIFELSNKDLLKNILKQLKLLNERFEIAFETSFKEGEIR